MLMLFENKDLENLSINSFLVRINTIRGKPLNDFKIKDLSYDH